MKFKEITNKKGMSLIDVIMAIGLFGIIFPSVVFFAVDALRFSKNVEKKVNAISYVQELSNAIYLNKNELWSSIKDNTDNGDKTISFANGRYSIVDGESTTNGITTKLTIEKVYRDSNGDIVTTGGTEDLRSRLITLSSSWVDITGRTISVESKVYVNDWNTNTWKETTKAEFDAGTNDLTVTDQISDGEVRLTPIVYSDWCKPQISLSAYDLPGQGVATSLTALPGNAFVGTGSNASGLSFANILMTDASPSVVTVAGTFDGYKTNAIYGETNYAYLATDTNDKEVVIVDLTTTPYTEVGYFDGSSSTNGDDVYVSNNKGFLIQGNNLRVFDLASKSGARTQLGTFSLLGQGKKVEVAGNYAYVLTANSTEMEVINISNPASMSRVATADLTGSVPVTNLHVDEDTNRVFISADYSVSTAELSVVDISTVSGARPTVGTFNTVDTSIKDVAVVPDNSRAVLVGSNGEEYQVLNITAIGGMFRCGGMNFDTGVNGVAAVGFIDSGNNYTYIVTNDSASELKIIRGGEGGGDINGNGYAKNGTYLSRIFDSGSATTTYYTLQGIGQISSNTTLNLQIRTGNTSDLSSATWVGPDGTAASYFTLNSIINLPSQFQNNRYIQYKGIFTSDSVLTPLLEEIRIDYQK